MDIEGLLKNIIFHKNKQTFVTSCLSSFTMSCYKRLILENDLIVVLWEMIYGARD